MTTLGPPELVRDVVDDETEESMGRCGKGNYGVVSLLMII